MTKAPTNPVWQLGYTGPGWQHRVLTEHLLHYGVIAWPDVSHSFTATGRLPAGLFARPLQAMSQAWRAVEADEEAAARRNARRRDVPQAQHDASGHPSDALTRPTK